MEIALDNKLSMKLAAYLKAKLWDDNIEQTVRNWLANSLESKAGSFAQSLEISRKYSAQQIEDFIILSKKFVR